MAKIKREELSGKFLEAFDKIVKLKNSEDSKQREAGLKGEKALEKLLSSKKGEAVKKEVKPKATPKAKAKATPKSKAKPKAKPKAKSKAKPKAKTKTSTTPKVLPFSTRASNLMKKEGLSWADAKAKLSKEIKDEKDKIEAKLKSDKKQALNELEKLTKAPEFQKALSQYPKKGGGKKRAIKTTLSNDGKRQALPRGKRVSKNGKTYYEYRDNRSDVNSLPAPKGQYKYKGKTPPYLADGGAIDSLKKDMNSKLDIHSEYYAKGGMIEIDEDGGNIPSELMEVFNDFNENEDSYKEMERLRLKAKEIGYDFDYDLSGQPTEFMKIDNYAKGGEIDEIIYSDLYQQLRSKDMFKSNFSTKPKMRKLFNPKNTDSFGSKRPYGISIGENRFILKYYYPNQEFRDDDFKTAKKIIASFYNSKSNMAKGGRTISIVNDGVTFDKSKYKAVYGDFDNDGTVNIDDANPLDKTKSGQVEQVELRKTFDKLLGVKAELDEIMYDAVETLDEKAPEGADIYARTKTPYSILKKLVEKRMLDPKRGLTDMIGTTIAVDNQKELEQVRDKIDGGLLGKVLDRDDFYKTPNAGYRAYHYIVEYKGVPVEVQLKTKNMKKLHEVSHEAYKNGTLNAKSLDSLSKTFMKADKGDAKAKSEISKLLSDKKLLASKISKGSMAKGGGIDDIITVFVFGLEEDANDFFEMADKFTDYDVLRLSPFAIQYNGGKEGFEFLLKRAENYESNLSDIYAKGGKMKESSSSEDNVQMPSQEEVDKFFALTNNETHYLNSKPVNGQEKTFNKMEVEAWDEYDLSNFNSLVRKAKSKNILRKPMYAKGGELKTLKIGDRIKDEFGYELEVYRTDNNKVYVEAPSGAIFTYNQKDFDDGTVELFWSNKSYYAKGGEVSMESYWDTMIKTNLDRIKRIDKIRNQPIKKLKEDKFNKNKSTKEIVDDLNELKKLRAVYKADNNKLISNFGGVKKYSEYLKKEKNENTLPFAKGGEVRRFTDIFGYTLIYKEEKIGNYVIGIRNGFNDKRHIFIHEGSLRSYGSSNSLPLNFKMTGQLNKGSQTESVYKQLKEVLRKNPNVETYKAFDEIKYAKGGKIGFDGLAKKVAKKYEGTRVPKEFQEQYGKTYNKKEAMEVGKKVAGKVYRQQQSMEKGGQTKQKYDYIPQEAIDELSYTMGKVSKSVSGSDVLSGAYVKSKGKGKAKSKGANDLTKRLLAMTDDEDKTKIILEKDVKAMQKYVSDKLITAFYLGLPKAYDFKGDYSYGGGIITYRLDAVKKRVSDTLKNIKANKFEMGLKYPQYDFEKLLGKPIIKDVFGKTFTFNDGSTEKYKYRLWIWKDCVIGQTIGSESSRRGGYTDYTYGEEPTLIGGYKSVQTSKASKLESIIEFMAKDKNGFVKDNDVLYNGLGGATFEALDKNKIKYEAGGKINSVHAVHIKDNMSLLNASKKYSNVKMGRVPIGSLVGQTYVTIDGKRQNLFVGDKYIAKNKQIIEVYKPSKGLYMRLEAGGTLPTPFGQAGLVGETGAMNEMDMFAMGGGLPQGVQQYYANTYNPAYPTPYGYAKGGSLDDISQEFYNMNLHEIDGEGIDDVTKLKAIIIELNKRRSYAKGGKTKRSKHSLMQDRRRVSKESWEVAYQKRKAKMEAGGLTKDGKYFKNKDISELTTIKEIKEYKGLDNERKTKTINNGIILIDNAEQIEYYFKKVSPTKYEFDYEEEFEDFDFAKGGSIKVGDKVKYPKATMVGKVTSIKDSDFERTLTIEYDDGKIINEGESSVIKFAKGGKIDTSKKGVYLMELKDGTFKVSNNLGDRDFPYEFNDVFPTKERAMKFANRVAKNSKSKIVEIKYAKGGSIKIGDKVKYPKATMVGKVTSIKDSDFERTLTIEYDDGKIINEGESSVIKFAKGGKLSQDEFRDGIGNTAFQLVEEGGGSAKLGENVEKGIQNYVDKFYAKGGKTKRSKHSLMQDRRRVSSESWEVAYQKRKAKMEAGGTLPTPFGQAGLVGETGAMNEMDMFAMGGGLPQGVHQYYANTYNPVYPTPHGYAKGGMVSESDKQLFIKHAQNYLKVFYNDERGANYRIEESYLPNLKKLDDKTYQVEYDGSAGTLLRQEFRLTKNSLKDVRTFEKSLLDKNPKWEEFIYEDGGLLLTDMQYLVRSYEQGGMITPQSRRLHKASMKQMGYAKVGDKVKLIKGAGSETIFRNFPNGVYEVKKVKKGNKSVPEGFYEIENKDGNKTQLATSRFETKYAKGGKTQGYNDKLDESLGNTKGKRSTKEQNYKDRRNESEAMEKKGGKRKYSRVKTMDKGNRKKRQTPMSLAKEIRKEGEKWQDAVKRASAMLKKK